jgi:hypothetical protein
MGTFGENRRKLPVIGLRGFDFGAALKRRGSAYSRFVSSAPAFVKLPYVELLLAPGVITLPDRLLTGLYAFGDPIPIRSPVIGLHPNCLGAFFVYIG